MQKIISGRNFPCIIDQNHLQLQHHTSIHSNGERYNDHNKKESDNQPAKVKMSGYLKKKRNKVGGWRKMWFVLQNQLLLSYSSKEDYDKKLVSFKDVLNLVPGTIVQPLGGLRFTIETTSNMMYTFRCDDSKTCTLWITALVESLALKPHRSIQNTSSVPKKLLNSNSLDNIQQPQPLSAKKPIRISYSNDSISRLNLTKYPNIPIADATARILQRNGISSNDMKKSMAYSNVKSIRRSVLDDDNSERARNFRLHEKRLSSGMLQTHSDEVSRINRMFSRSTNNVDRNSFASTIVVPSSDGNVPSSIGVASVISLKEGLRRERNIITNENNCYDCKNIKSERHLFKKKYHLTDLKTLNNLFSMDTIKDKSGSSSEILSFNNKCNKDKFSDSYEYGYANGKNEMDLRDLNQNKMTCMDDGILNKNCAMDNYECTIQEKLQGLNLKESTANKISSSSTILPLIKNNSDLAKISPSRITSTKEKGQTTGFYTETEFPLIELESQHHNSHYSLSKEEILFPSVSNSSGCNSSIATNSSSITNSPIGSSLQSPIVNSYEKNMLPTSNSVNMKLCLSEMDPRRTSDHRNNIVTHESNRLSSSAELLNKIEPIYAVVDLKNKYARRARIRELQEQMKILSDAKERERPKSLHCISSDYEEVLNFECLGDEGDEDEDEDENENIYEPINIPEHSYHHTRHALWKYIRRINIEALLELARNRKSRPEPIKLPNQITAKHISEDSTQHSPFSDIRRKLGNHRKSIKLRMKRFYHRSEDRNLCTPVVLVKERNAFSDDELDSQGATGSTSGTSENSVKSSKSTGKPTTYVFGELDKYRRSQKQFFGSLSRLRKTRASLCIQDDHGGSKKKFLISPKNSRSQQDARLESLTKLNRKRDETSNQSKFYD